MTSCPHCKKDLRMRIYAPEAYLESKRKSAYATHQKRRVSRQALYMKIIELRGKGLGYDAISSNLRCGKTTVSRALQTLVAQ